LTEQGHLRLLKEEERQKRFEEYVEKYGLDNAQYLIEMETQWLNNYGRVALINLGIGREDVYRTFAKNVAQAHGWDYAEVQGDTGLIQHFLDGDWNDKDFLIVPPGCRIIQTYDDDVLGIEEAIDGGNS
jgi:hypothetical protein